MDAFHKLLQWVDYHRGLVCGLIVTMAFAVWSAGCAPKTYSTVEPGQRVDAAQIAQEQALMRGQFAKRASALAQMEQELTADMEVYGQKEDAAITDLESQVQRRQQVQEVAGALASQAIQGTLTPAGVINGILLVGGIATSAGLGIDVLRKNKVIKDQKTAAAITG